MVGCSSLHEYPTIYAQTLIANSQNTLVNFHGVDSIVIRDMMELKREKLPQHHHVWYSYQAWAVSQNKTLIKFDG